MSSTLIVGALIFGFVIYVTAKGELPTYLSIFGVGANVSSTSTAAGATTTAGNVAQDFSGAVSGIGSIGNLFGSSGNQDFSGAVTG